MKKVLLFIWQLPQNLLGLFVILATGARRKESYWRTGKGLFGVSLGTFVIFGDYKGRRIISEKSIKHERGHQKQSLYLGWLYLIIIGLPSAVGNLLNRVFSFNYYKQPWEAWADRLGGVER